MSVISAQVLTNMGHILEAAGISFKHGKSRVDSECVFRFLQHDYICIIEAVDSNVGIARTRNI